GVPDALETVALRADEHRRLLTPAGAPAQGRKVVRRELQRVQQVVDVLDVDDRPQTAQRRADPLTEDGGLADARVADAMHAVPRLQALEHEVHVSETAHVLSEDHETRIAREVLVE